MCRTDDCRRWELRQDNDRGSSDATDLLTTSRAPPITTAAGHRALVVAEDRARQVKAHGLGFHNTLEQPLLQHPGVTQTQTQTQVTRQRLHSVPSSPHHDSSE